MKTIWDRTPYEQLDAIGRHNRAFRDGALNGFVIGLLLGLTIGGGLVLSPSNHSAEQHDRAR